MTTDEKQFEPEPIEWMPLSPKSVRVLTRQLKREIPKKDHPLSGAAFTMIAKSASTDDVLLALPSIHKWAICHMTWSKTRERPPWPGTAIVDDLASILKEC